MMRWILEKMLGNHKAQESSKSQSISPTFMLEQSIAYSAFISGRGEQISFGEFLQRKALTQ